MPSSTILRFTDPSEYQAAIGRAGSDSQTVIEAAGSYQSELVRVDLHHVSVYQGRISLPRITHAAGQKKQCRIIFPTAETLSRETLNGIEVAKSDLTYCGPDSEFVARASAGCWGGITVPPEILFSASRSLVGYEVIASKLSQLIRTLPPLMARLHNVHRAITRLATAVPDILENLEVSRAIEQELLRAFIACLADPVTIRQPKHKRQNLMRRFHQVIEANQDAPLYLTQICAAVGVTERTLHSVCADYLRMSPHKYLLLRRMNLVRKALTLADPASKTVTSVANDYGFAELGRFSVRYRAMFGESPSATLRHTSARGT
jgi:AraC-like DNA-binding protein